MREKIQKLIEMHKLAKLETHTLLEELYQIDDSKLLQSDKHTLDCSKIALEMQLNLEASFLSELEDLL